MCSWHIHAENSEVWAKIFHSTFTECSVVEHYSMWCSIPINQFLAKSMEPAKAITLELKKVAQVSQRTYISALMYGTLNRNNLCCSDSNTYSKKGSLWPFTWNTCQRHKWWFHLIFSSEYPAVLKIYEIPSQYQMWWYDQLVSIAVHNFGWMGDLF